MNFHQLFTLIIGLMTVSACASPVRVPAVYETHPVKTWGDSVDDPAIWLNAQNAQKSLVFGANKKGALYAYDLEGKIVASYPNYTLNNIDVRYDIEFKNQKWDILAGSHKGSSSFVVFGINAKTGALKDLTGHVKTTNSAYGLCLYKDLRDKSLHVFITSKTGKIEKYSLNSQGKMTPSGSFKIPGQTEGCVADDEFGKLYLAEEESGIWKYDANTLQEGQQVMRISQSSQFQKDLEGLALYDTGNGEGYLLVSVQGNNSFAVLNRKDQKYLGSFKIDIGPIDSVEDTDGIDVLPGYLGPEYPSGIFVAQDGINRGGGVFRRKKQNFKFVSWQSVAEGFSVPLKTVNDYNPRKLILRY